jgi:hypothetical protein
MNGRKNLLILLGEWWEQRQTRPRTTEVKDPPRRARRVLRWLTPNGGTLLLAAALIAAAQVWAKPLASPASAPGPSATTVNYQGRLANPDGSPVTDDTYGMTFALYDAATDGSLVWGPESHTAVPVSEGLFSVGLGSIAPIPTSTWNGDRYLEVTVGGETLSPRELIRSVPIAGMALTVPDGSITTGKIVDGTITQSDAPFAPLTYWYFVDNTPDSNMKVAVSAHVFDLAGANSKNIDISAYGFTSRPLGICEIADTSATVQSYFCAYSWDDSDANTAHLRFYRYDGGSTGPSGNLRITLFLMGK